MRTIFDFIKSRLSTLSFSALALATMPALTMPAHADQYQTCIGIAMQNPDAAYDYALQWENTDTTGGALHCGAIALMGLQLFDSAAERFEKAANVAQGAEGTDRATLFRQAGEAWLAANNGAKAVDAFTSGLHFLPKDPALLFGRARGHDLAEAPALGLVDVSDAISVAPERSDFLVLRARFHRQLKQFDAALLDLNAALSAGADAIPVHLERGVLLFEQGDEAGARKDWQVVIDRDRREDGSAGAAGQIAAQFIAELDQAPSATQP